MTLKRIDESWLTNLAGDFRQLFGSIDVDSFETACRENLRRAVRGAAAPETEVWSSRVVLSYCSEQLTAAQKSALSKCEFALCVRLRDDERAPSLYTANTIYAAAISSVWSVFKRAGIKTRRTDIIQLRRQTDNIRRMPRYRAQTFTMVIMPLFGKFSQGRPATGG